MTNKSISIIVILAVVVVITVAFYIFFITSHLRVSDVPIPVSKATLYIDRKEVFQDVENLLIIDSLTPDITIKHSPDLRIQEILLDDRINLLLDTPLLGGIKITKMQGELSIKLPFLLSPSEHIINIKTVDENNLQSSYEFRFLLGVRSKFTESIEESDFFILPETTKTVSPESWKVVNGKLIGTAPNNGHASLTFIYPFSDIFASFRLTPKEGPLNLIFYFLQNGRSIVIGNGDNKRITLLRVMPYLDEAIDGRPFMLEPQKGYMVFISRVGTIYRLYIVEHSNEIDNLFSQATLLLEFDDSNLPSREDSVGFAIWRNSAGFEINDLTVSPFRHW